MLQTYKTKLVHKQKHDGNIYVFRFICEDPDAVVFKAGQYLILHVPQSDGITKRKYYSISSPATGDRTFELLVKILPQGIGSDYLSSLELGAPATFEGPAGVFTLKDDDVHKGRSKIFIATGTGLAPVRSILLTHLPSHPEEKFILFWGVQTKESAYYLDELAELKKKHSNFDYMLFLSREKELAPEDAHFTLGRVNIGLERLKEVEKIPFNSVDVYISGVREIVESLHKYTLELGADPGHIVVEKFI